MELPTVTELKQAAESGQRITPEDVSAISHAESVYTGRGPVRGGPAGRSLDSSCGSDGADDGPATAQSLAMRQINFDSKLDEMSQKPHSHITQQDAREMQASEVSQDVWLRIDRTADT